MCSKRVKLCHFLSQKRYFCHEILENTPRTKFLQSDLILHFLVACDHDYDHDGDDGDDGDPIILIILFIDKLFSKAVINTTITIIKLISGVE